MRPDFSPYLFPISTLGLSLVLLVRLRPSRDFPVKLLLVIWVGVFTAHYGVIRLGLMDLYPVSLEASAVVLAALAVLIGGYFTAALWISRREARPPAERRPARLEFLLDVLFLAYSLVVLVWMANVAASIVGLAPSAQALQLLRTSLNYEGADWGAVKYAASSVYVAAIYLVAKNREQPPTMRALAFTLLGVAILIGVLSTQRTAVFMLLVAAFFCDAERRRPSFRASAILVLSLLTVFFGVGLALGKAGRFGLSPLENAELALQSLGVYALSPLSALDVSLSTHAPITGGSHTLRFPLVILGDLGLYKGELESTVREFVAVPVPTNVYTFVEAPLLDFGVGGIWYLFAMGILVGIIFRLPTAYPSVRTLQGFAYYPLVLSFFHDQFLTITSMWLQVFILTFSFAFLYRFVHQVELDLRSSLPSNRVMRETC